MLENRFNSKILLFGEYSIIKGSQGLAFPFDKYSGELMIAENSIAQETLDLADLCDYIQNSHFLSSQIDFENFNDDLKKGLYFNSNIPQGCGIGSSGALCAAVVSRYGKLLNRNDVIDNKKIKFLQDVMALLESFYHGTSSGLDPLISYIDDPILIEGRNKKQIVEDFPYNMLENIFVIDTKISRKTSSYVHEFLQMLEKNIISSDQLEELSQLADNCISSFLNRNNEELFNNFYHLSKFQYLNFSKMIPKEFQKLWLDGIESKDYLLKLCGAGGGGFILGISKNQRCDLPNIQYLIN